jgi:single-stranded-DNA-specific exonuclease
VSARNEETASALLRSRVRVRPRDPACETRCREAGLDPWLARFLSARLGADFDPERLGESTFAALPDPAGIPGMTEAVERILRALESRESIVCACDHDVDGTASAAVLSRAFLEAFGHPAERFRVVTSHRIREGYGLTQPVVDRILDLGATLVVTADKGSGDEPRLRRLREAGVDVIVTDHHEIGPEGPPPSAFACLNPCRPDAVYDRTICGAAVAFVTVMKVARTLAARGRPPRPGLMDLVDYVGVATIADCVSLRPDRGGNNRSFVRRSLARINRGTRPCWRVLLRAHRGPVSEETVAFRLAPAINACGRLDWSDLAIRFFLAETDEEAEDLWDRLERENRVRRRVDTRLTERAFAALEHRPEDPAVVVFFDQDGHVGVQGIVASRLCEATGRPTVVLSRMGAGDRDGPVANVPAGELLTGSVRGIPGFHVREALQEIADSVPDLLVSFGGHEGAGGLRLRRRDFEAFRAAFAVAVAHRFPDGVRPVFWIDDFCDGADLPPGLGTWLAGLAPFGKDFPPPLLCGRLDLLSVRALGSGGHFRLEIRAPQGRVPALWFARARRGRRVPPRAGETGLFIYRARPRRTGTAGDEAALELEILHALEDDATAALASGGGPL